MSSMPVAVEAESMGRPPKDTVQITFRVPSSWLGEADQIASMLARPGFEAGRTDGFRAAMARGFEVLRAELAQAAADADRRAEAKPKAKR